MRLFKMSIVIIMNDKSLWASHRHTRWMDIYIERETTEKRTYSTCYDGRGWWQQVQLLRVSLFKCGRMYMRSSLERYMYIVMLLDVGHPR